MVVGVPGRCHFCSLLPQGEAFLTVGAEGDYEAAADQEKAWVLALVLWFGGLKT